MKKFNKLFCICLFFFCQGLFAQNLNKIDTLYYDSEWKVVPDKAFAEYYRVALYPKDSNARKLIRDYYIDGTLQAKGEFIYIDAVDDSNSIFDGTLECYFKNGKLSLKRTYNNGKLNGECIEYTEDGLIKRAANFNNGELTGLYTQFNEDGTYSQIEYSYGKPIHDYYIYGDQNGHMVKVNLVDNSILWETPDVSERHTLFKDGTPWQVYFKNGLTIAETTTTVNDYGKWHRIDLIISNESIAPIEFDPEQCISAFSVDKKERETTLEVWSCERYMKKVNRAQKWAAIAVGLTNGLAAATAGYSSSTTTTNGFYSGHSNYSGYGSVTSTTRTYDATAAYQAQIISQQRMADFSNAQWQEKQAKQIGYLKKNTIYPGETISGFVHIKRVKGKSVYITITIKGAEYIYGWNYGK